VSFAEHGRRVNRRSRFNFCNALGSSTDSWHVGPQMPDAGGRICRSCVKFSWVSGCTSFGPALPQSNSETDKDKVLLLTLTWSMRMGSLTMLPRTAGMPSTISESRRRLNSSISEKCIPFLGCPVLFLFFVTGRPSGPGGPFGPAGPKRPPGPEQFVERFFVPGANQDPPGMM
jgi:hypothetical protein